VFPIRLTDHLDDDRTRIVPIAASGPLSHEAGELSAEIDALAEGCAAAGDVTLLPRPLRRPRNVVLVGVGAGDEAGWRAAGAAAIRDVGPGEPVQVMLPGEGAPDAVRGLAEGLWLGGYRFRDGREDRRSAAVELISPAFSAYVESMALATASARAAWLARDLTNTPSSLKNPAWLAEELVGAAAGRTGVEVRIRSGAELDRFGGLRAVGGGSVSPPCLVEMSWSPAGARTHVALVGKGITFDSGGLSIKTREGMKRMKVDMGGAAAVAAATLGAAELELPVRVTALLPLAENAVGADAYRPGDVITHYDGTTSESTNSDAEGRLAGERMWRLPLPDDYREYLRSDLADRHSSPVRGAGSVVAALYLAEFLGA
jgi:leucyl aminopeptidase